MRNARTLDNNRLPRHACVQVSPEHDRATCIYAFLRLLCCSLLFILCSRAAPCYLSMQSPALTSALATWLSSFQADWVNNEATQQLHAHIRQRHVHGLCQTLVVQKQRLKTSKEEVRGLVERRRRTDIFDSQTVVLGDAADVVARRLRLAEEG